MNTDVDDDDYCCCFLNTESDSLDDLVLVSSIEFKPTRVLCSVFTSVLSEIEF